MEKVSVLFFGTEEITALPVIRAFKKAYPQSRIIAVSPKSDTFKIAEKSRFVRQKVHFLSSFDDGESLVQELSDIINKTNPQVVLPIGIKHVKFLSRYQNILAQHTQLPPLPDLEILNRLTQKDQLNDILDNLDLASVKSKKIETDSPNELNWHCFPCLLKPILEYSGHKIRRINSREELEYAFQHIDLTGKFIIQIYINGYDIDCSFLAKDGNIIAHTIQKGIRENKLSFPTAIKMTHSPMVLEYVEKLLSKTNYSGIAHLDFRYDTFEQKIKLIDFNARFWSSILASESVGVNFAKLIYLSANHISFSPPDYEEGYYFMGKDTVKEIYKSVKQGKFKTASNYNYDLSSRLKDPLPEALIIASKIKLRS